jgi:glycosyltransferase involved in cell wall biosynthesis
LKKILFISHDAARAGAPILLLRFLKELKKEGKFAIDILLKCDGPLIDEFEKIANVTLWNKHFKPFNSDTASNIYHKINRLEAFHRRKNKQYQNNIIQNIEQKKYDLIVANTIASGNILYEFRKINCPIVSYIHELAMGFELFSEPKYIQKQLLLSNYYWVPSQAVAKYLQQNHHIAPEKITVLRTIIEPATIEKTASKQLKTKLQIPDNKIVVGTVATLDLRKGYDIFLEIAANCHSHSNIHFVWLGANTSSTEYDIAKKQIEQLGIQNSVTFCEATAEPHLFYEVFDLLLLPSREDPYPLIVLEAAQHAKPTVCFDERAGGACDFVATDCGLVVPFLDTQSMTQAILTLTENPEKRIEMGKFAKQKVEERHNIQAGSKQLHLLLEQYLT